MEARSSAEQMQLLSIAALAALLAIVQPAAGHGMMTIPPARNWLAYVEKNYYYPDNNNAGGYQVTGQFGAVKWPNGKHSLCGDKADGPHPFMKPGPIKATYKAGQTVDLHVLISTNHYGRFYFRLCPKDATKDGQCENLWRADGEGVSWDLPMIAQGRKFNGGAHAVDVLRPMSFDGFYDWYPQPHINCPWYAGCDRYDNFPVYKLKYKLPKDFTCDHCILQWYYITGHKCNPPCLPKDKYYPNCRANPRNAGTYLAVMDYCGSQWAAYPEEFWNCADIKITK